VLTLVRTHTLDDSDFIGKETYVLADGSKLESTRFRLRDLQIGDIVVHDVTASVAPVAGQLLLGESFLSHFASWTLDNTRHVLILTSGG
jgi:predicted aspartyl protease